MNKTRLLKEGPHCGDDTNEPCGGTGCGDGATWQDVELGNGWCQCKNTNGSHCGSVNQDISRTKTIRNTGMRHTTNYMVNEDIKRIKELL